MSWSDQRAAADAIAAFRERSLAPAHAPPMMVAGGPLESVAGAVRGTATVVRPESAPWNLWSDGPRLFNDGTAFLFEVEIAGPPGLRWNPAGSTLQVNSPKASVPALPVAEALLVELEVAALQQERWILDGDLVQRLRGAGAFRQGYLHETATGLAGLVAFPRSDPEGHVVAMRLTLAVVSEGRPVELEWVFQ